MQGKSETKVMDTVMSSGVETTGKNFCIQRQENWSWWLRSEEEHPTLPENDGMCAGAISRRVVICFFVNEYCGVSPVLNVRLSDVLMVSIVEGTAGQTGAAYKLTLINPAMESDRSKVQVHSQKSR